MSTSTALQNDNMEMSLVKTRVAPGVPLFHEQQEDVFARHDKVLGHTQKAMEGVSLGLVGAGGLNSWTGLGLARAGATAMTFMDADNVELSNFARQLFFPGQLDKPKDPGKPKAHCLIDNLADHATTRCTLTGIALPFQEAIDRYSLPVDLLVVGVDNNACRLACATWARSRRIPAVFTMLSTDGIRCHCFFQGPDATDACLWCAQPNMDPNEIAECGVGSIITSCFLASAYAIFFVHRAVMGWPEGIEPFNLREADLTGVSPERTAMVRQRPHCAVCGR